MESTSIPAYASRISRFEVCAAKDLDFIPGQAKETENSATDEEIETPARNAYACTCFKNNGLKIAQLKTSSSH